MANGALGFYAKSRTAQQVALLIALAPRSKVN
jgi:hypothetical protein